MLKKIVAVVIVAVISTTASVADAARYTGYGSAANANAAMGYRAAKVDAMRQAGGSGPIVEKGRTEDGGYYVVIER